MKDLRERMEATGKDHVGVSDSGNIFLIESIAKEFPEAKYIIILRDTAEVVNSFHNIGIQIDAEVIDSAREELEWRHSSFGTPAYDFNELTETNCKRIWKYLIGTEFDPQRWALLNNLMIEVNVDYLKNQIKKNEANVKALMETA